MSRPCRRCLQSVWITAFRLYNFLSLYSTSNYFTVTQSSVAFIHIHPNARPRRRAMSKKRTLDAFFAPASKRSRNEDTHFGSLREQEVNVNNFLTSEAVRAFWHINSGWLFASPALPLPHQQPPFFHSQGVIYSPCQDGKGNQWPTRLGYSLLWALHTKLDISQTIWISSLWTALL